MTGLQRGKVFGKWRFEQEIGSGGFGLVTSWRNLDTNERMVIKQCRHALDAILRRRWEEEIHLMYTNHHKNLVAGRDVPSELIEAIKAPEALLGLEYCDSDLRKVLSSTPNCTGLKQNSVLNVLRDVSYGLQFLHNKKIIHRDMKPENILSCHQGNEVVFKITDLGYAKALDAKTLCMTFVGTIQYLAPELYDQTGYKRSVDYWSFGTVIFECITGMRPFHLTDKALHWRELIQKKSDEDIWGIYNEIKKEVSFASDIPAPNHLCQPLLRAFRDWLQLVLRYNPEKRGKRGTSVICFEKINQILEMKIIEILHVLSCTHIAYESLPNQKGIDLKTFITKQLNIPVEEQELVFAVSGDVLGDEDSLERCHQQPDIIYLFNKNKNAKHSITNMLPEKVRELVGSPEDQHKVDDLRIYWAHSLYYCNKRALDYSHLLQGQRALMINILKSKYLHLQRLKDELSKSAVKLETVINMYNEIHEVDSKSYPLADRSSFGEEYGFNDWEVVSKEITSYKEFIKIGPLIDSVNTANRCFLTLQKSPMVAEQQVQNDLDDLARQAEEILKKLRRRSKDEKHASVQMCNIILECIHKTEKLFTYFYQHLKKVTSSRDEINNLIIKMEDAIKCLKTKEATVLKRQLYQQRMLWRLFHNKQPSESLQNVPNVISVLKKEFDQPERDIPEIETVSVIDHVQLELNRLDKLVKEEEIVQTRREEHSHQLKHWYTIDSYPGFQGEKRLGYDRRCSLPVNTDCMQSNYRLPKSIPPIPAVPELFTDFTEGVEQQYYHKVSTSNAMSPQIYATTPPQSINMKSISQQQRDNIALYNHATISELSKISAPPIVPQGLPATWPSPMSYSPNASPQSHSTAYTAMPPGSIDFPAMSQSYPNRNPDFSRMSLNYLRASTASTKVPQHFPPKQQHSYELLTNPDSASLIGHHRIDPSNGRVQRQKNIDFANEQASVRNQAPSLPSQLYVSGSLLPSQLHVFAPIKLKHSSLTCQPELPQPRHFEHLSKTELRKRDNSQFSDVNKPLSTSFKGNRFTHSNTDMRYMRFQTRIPENIRQWPQ